MRQARPDPWRVVAMECYGAAGELKLADRWRSAVSRAYYAAYSRVSASLRESGLAMSADRDGPSHATLPGLVENNLTIMRVQDRPGVSSRLRTLYALRLTADYFPSVPVGESDAQQALHLMAEVFRRLKQVKEPGQ
jgi:uncharacterized protein (UPF0332 family)